MTDPTPSGYSLAEVLDTTAASSLLADLQKLRGNPIEIAGGAVSRISALCVQVLLSAAMTWKADGMSFSINLPSDALREAMRVLGVNVGQIETGGATR